MKRSLFSVLVLSLVMAFLYVPLMLVCGYGFVPNGSAMSFYGPGAPRRIALDKYIQSYTLTPGWTADGKGFPWTSNVAYQVMATANIRLGEAEQALGLALGEYRESLDQIEKIPSVVSGLGAAEQTLSHVWMDATASFEKIRKIGTENTEDVEGVRARIASIHRRFGEGLEQEVRVRRKVAIEEKSRLVLAEQSLTNAWQSYTEALDRLKGTEPTTSAALLSSERGLQQAWQEYRESLGQEVSSLRAKRDQFKRSLPELAQKVRKCKMMQNEANRRLESSFGHAPKEGEIRLFLDRVQDREFAALIVGSGAFHEEIVPLSPHAEPASSRELKLEGHVFQLWNACSAAADVACRSVVVATVSQETLARVKGAIDAAQSFGYLHLDAGTYKTASGLQREVARYERRFLASDLKLFHGFSGKWYQKLFSGSEDVEALMDGFWLSLVIAGLSTLISCVLGTTAALALHRWRDRLQSIHHTLVYTPLIMPDILIGISLLMLFVAVKIECGFWTILIAHVTFCVSYVAMTVLARLQDFDDRIIEASYDLGAGPWYTFFHVELPILLPGIVAGGLLAFTLSIDDVVITSFVNGAGTNTFPTYVSSMTKHSRNLPAVFALSTLMLIFTCLMVGVSKLLSAKSLAKLKGK